jgi:hypothetical protein
MAEVAYPLREQVVTICRDCETMPATRMTEAMNFDRS